MYMKREMKKLSGITWCKMVLIIPIIGMLSGCASAGNDGFTKIFNGKDLEGWYLKTRDGDPETAEKLFAVENGLAHPDPAVRKLIEAAKLAAETQT